MIIGYQRCSSDPRECRQSGDARLGARPRVGRYVLVLSLLFATHASAQSTCGQAVWQLQQYAINVNGIASAEYYQGIPARCAGNPICMQAWLGQLNAWYVQQTALVNNWYAQLVLQCTQQGPGNRRLGRRPGGDRPGEIDITPIEDLEIDDEDRAVRIRIPSTPNGFR
ncbi:MAG TPA: hypothetical protein VF339_20085 [Gammaproteobacteria bacterium]